MKNTKLINNKLNEIIPGMNIYNTKPLNSNYFVKIKDVKEKYKQYDINLNCIDYSYKVFNKYYMFNSYFKVIHRRILSEIDKIIQEEGL